MFKYNKKEQNKNYQKLPFITQQQYYTSNTGLIGVYFAAIYPKSKIVQPKLNYIDPFAVYVHIQRNHPPSFTHVIENIEKLNIKFYAIIMANGMCNNCLQFIV